MRFWRSGGSLLRADSRRSGRASPPVTLAPGAPMITCGGNGAAQSPAVERPSRRETALTSSPSSSYGGAVHDDRHAREAPAIAGEARLKMFQ